MDPKTKQLVEEAEAHLTATPEGNWVTIKDLTRDGAFWVGASAYGPAMISSIHHMGYEKNKAIADFVAFTHNNIKELCSAVREQDKLLDAWQLATNATSPEYAKEVHDRRLAEIERLLKEYQDASKRACHAEAERDAFDKRITELEIENKKLSDAIVAFTDQFATGEPLTYQRVAAGVVALRRLVNV